MTDLPGSPDEGGAADQDRDEHAEVRELLAGLGEEKIPAEVAARLDAALDGLVAERPATDDRDTGAEVAVPAVLPLEEAAARRRRWAPRVLAAATVAAIVGGIGVSIAQLPGSSGGGAASGTADTTALRDGGNSAHKSARQFNAAEVAALPRLSRKHFRTDAARLLVSDNRLLRPMAAPGKAPTAGSTMSRQPVPATESPETASGGTTDGLDQAVPKSLSGVLATCGHRRGLPAGTRALPVLLDGRPATLVVQPRSHGVAQVTAYACSGSTVLASATVPR